MDLEQVKHEAQNAEKHAYSIIEVIERYQKNPKMAESAVRNQIKKLTAAMSRLLEAANT